MKATLVLLLAPCLPICYGEWQKTIEMPLEDSCPDPADIEPCECTNNGKLTMDCSKVQDEEELRNVFSAFFPSTKFYDFNMRDNRGVQVLEDGVFGNVSFYYLFIYETDLATVEPDALAPSFSTLTYLLIEFCKLEIFPFERLAEFTSLHQLSFPYNNIHTLPSLSSSSLTFLSLSDNFITNLMPDVFKLLPAVELITLNYNQLTEIPKGTFTGLPKLGYVSIYGNSITYLESLTFDLVFSPNYTTALHLEDNNIVYVEVDAFKGVAGFANISMARNALTSLPEEVWRPVLEKSISVNLGGNDLECGCDVAWLVRDSQLLPMAFDASCPDGTLLTHLNPGDFDHCD